MTTREQLIQELEQAPEDLLQEVLNFVLATKQAASRPIAQASTAIQSADSIQSLLDLVDSMPLTPEEIASLPHDGAENHDHYLYGAPKKLV